MIEIDVGDCDLTTFARAEPEEPKNPSKRHLKFPKKGSILEAARRSPIRVGSHDLDPITYPPTAPTTKKAIAIIR